VGYVFRGRDVHSIIRDVTVKNVAFLGSYGYGHTALESLSCIRAEFEGINITQCGNGFAQRYQSWHAKLSRIFAFADADADGSGRPPGVGIFSWAGPGSTIQNFGTIGYNYSLVLNDITYTGGLLQQAKKVGFLLPAGAINVLGKGLQLSDEDALVFPDHGVLSITPSQHIDIDVELLTSGSASTKPFSLYGKNAAGPGAGVDFTVSGVIYPHTGQTSAFFIDSVGTTRLRLKEPFQIAAPRQATTNICEDRPEMVDLPNGEPEAPIVISDADRTLKWWECLEVEYPSDVDFTGNHTLKLSGADIPREGATVTVRMGTPNEGFFLYVTGASDEVLWAFPTGAEQTLPVTFRWST
jgi:hypothetical protein